MAGITNPDYDLGDAVHPFYQLIRLLPLVGFSINKFQPTLTMVKYLPTWHLVGDSQSLGMLQTGPLQAKSLPQREGREEMQAWAPPFPGNLCSLSGTPNWVPSLLACVLECPPGEGSYHACFCLLEPRWSTCAGWLGGVPEPAIVSLLQAVSSL